MNLKFLGGGSAEGIPALFCRCGLCREAREKNKYFTRSQLLVNNDLLIDFPPDSYYRAVCAGVDLADIKHILITHSHSDHFYPEDFFMRGLASSHGLDAEPLCIYGSEAVASALSRLANAVPYEEYRHKPKETFYGTTIYPQSATYKKVRPFEIFSAGEYTVAALPSEHMPSEPSYVYAVSHKGKSFFYATDTAPLSEKVYDFLQYGGYKFDCVICDGTYGNLDFDEGHMNFADCAETLKILLSRGLLSRNCKSFITHVSHNAARSLAQLESSIPECFSLAYDGLTVAL